MASLKPVIKHLVRWIVKAEYVCIEDLTMAGKVWMIAGASHGLGAEIAKAVLATGEKLIATAREPHTLEHLSGRESMLPVGMDVTDQTQVKTGVREGARSAWSGTLAN